MALGETERKRVHAKEVTTQIEHHGHDESAKKTVNHFESKCDRIAGEFLRWFKKVKVRYFLIRYRLHRRLLFFWCVCVRAVCAINTLYIHTHTSGKIVWCKNSIANQCRKSGALAKEEARRWRQRSQATTIFWFHIFIHCTYAYINANERKKT